MHDSSLVALYDVTKKIMPIYDTIVNNYNFGYQFPPMTRGYYIVDFIRAQSLNKNSWVVELNYFKRYSCRNILLSLKIY